jgi:hypothetical protein
MIASLGACHALPVKSALLKPLLAMRRLRAKNQHATSGRFSSTVIDTSNSEIGVSEKEAIRIGCQSLLHTVLVLTLKRRAIWATVCTAPRDPESATWIFNGILGDW